MEKLIPEKYKSKLRIVNVTGANEYAWEFNTLMDFLNDPESDSFAILGGDVLILNENQEINYTYDNWGIDSRSAGEIFLNYCKRSKKHTVEYLKKYPVKKENLFVLVMTSEITAGILGQ